MAAMLDGSGGAAQAGWATRPTRTTTSAKSTMRATRLIASPYNCSSDCCARQAPGRHGLGAVAARCLAPTTTGRPGAANRLPAPTTLLPPELPLIVLDLDLLLADLFG